LNKKPARFGIELVDLAEGRSEVICEYEDLHNPHPQFDRHEGRQILVQHNRGAEYDDEGLPVKGRGKAGVGLFLVDVNGNVSPLEVGLPYTADLTGHQCWLGTTGEILTTANPAGDYPYFVVAGVREGEAHRVVARIECPSGGGHIGSPPHGEFYTVDRSSKIGGGVFVGSPRSGQLVKVCETSSTGVENKWGQSGHAHAYLTPDLSKVVFNSLANGSPQIFMATVPPSLIESLDPTFRQ
jgi:hypothetical protein